AKEAGTGSARPHVPVEGDLEDGAYPAVALAHRLLVAEAVAQLRLAAADLLEQLAEDRPRLGPEGHRPSIPARSRAGMLFACGSASAGTAPHAASSCQSRHMMTAKRKAANTS